MPTTLDTSLNTFSSQYSGNNDKPARVSSEKLIPDIRKCLELQVGKTGEINTEYGGFEITVNEPSYFPWYDVFATLLKFGYEVWVTVKKEKMVIVAKLAGD